MSEDSSVKVKDPMDEGRDVGLATADPTQVPAAGNRPLEAKRAPHSAVASFVYERVRTFGGALGALLVISIYLSISQPFFLTSSNILNILSGNATLLIVSVGMTFALLSAGYDLSVGAVVAGCGLITYTLVHAGVPVVLAFIAAALSGAVYGAVVNGLLIGRFGLNFFVVTLGTMSAVYGLVDVATNGQTKSLPATGVVNELGSGKVGPIPMTVIVSFGVLIVAWVVLKRTRFGRAVYAVGGNREAARLAGINVPATLIAVYAIVGLCAGVGGVVEAARLTSASPSAGSTFDLTAGATALLGGTSFFGGIGGPAGTLVGVLLLGVIQNGLGLLGVSAFWEGVVEGAVLVAAVVLDRVGRRS